MKMKMKMKGALLLLSVGGLVVLTLRPTDPPGRSSDGPPTPTHRPTTTTTNSTAATTGLPAQNLNGKMFTLTLNRGQLSLYPPSHPPDDRPPGYPNKATLPRPTTMVSPTTGVSVCLRYITDFLTTRSPSLFTLGASSNVLGLGVREDAVYWMHLSSFSYDYVSLKPIITLWPDIRSDIWTTACIIVDSRKNVAQIFSGSNTSIRRLLPLQFVWSGDPVLDFSGFDGHITDVQMWDYPLRYGDVYNYMTRGVYGPYRGSVLSWSYISYSVRGTVLLEDDYETKQSVGTRGPGPPLHGETQTQRFKETDKENRFKEELKSNFV